jgi:hypothetical protein
VVERKSYSEGRIFDLSRQTGRSPPTLRRWARQGCDLDDPVALKAFLERMDSRKPPVERTKSRNYSRVRNRPTQTQVPPESAKQPRDHSDSSGNGELPAPGRRGAGAALERLEYQEEESRLQVALERGDALAIEAAQSFWLQCSEVLRRLDLAVEVARRQEETQIPLRQAEDVVTYVTEWLRISVTQFLSSETVALMGIKTPSDFRAYFLERFAGVLNLTIRNADKTRSSIPSWAKARIEAAWNMQLPPEAAAAPGTPAP